MQKSFRQSGQTILLLWLFLLQLWQVEPCLSERGEDFFVFDDEGLGVFLALVGADLGDEVFVIACGVTGVDAGVAGASLGAEGETGLRTRVIFCVLGDSGGSGIASGFSGIWVMKYRPLRSR